MNRLRELYEITIQLKKTLVQEITAKDREAVIEQVNELIDKRSIHLQHVNPPFTEEEKVLGKELVVLNEEIQTKMLQLFNDLKSEMKQIKKQRKSNMSYTNPYKSVQTLDGMFMDRKK
ncbi:flagellar protein FliT [Virgibacillus indicus]|uniref:Flagellar protein FliT n=1 Tax=Virgibacillus indicus TaxID=2024554 RepID=A0A265N9W7_9BACI|nr:flagellar protein FliT [Virgibacillus indicus]OZU88793.1 flagellar protein FliT [Virgibacillus indicus]